MESDFKESDFKFEQRIFDLGITILKNSKNNLIKKFTFKNLEDKFIQLPLKSEKLKLSLFRFVDVVPSLRNNNEIISHLNEYFLIKIPNITILRNIISLVAKISIKQISKKFILGSSPKESIPKLIDINNSGKLYTVDLLGEAALSEKTALNYLDRYKELIDILSINSSLLSKNESPVSISVKLSSLYPGIDNLNFDQSINILSSRLSELLAKAKESNGVVYIDMEESSLIDITLQVAKKVLNQESFKNYDKFGIVLQAYLKRTENDIEEILTWVKDRPNKILIRLVKGAYWDTEVMSAKSKDWEVPVFEKKSHSDFNYEKLTKKLLDNHKYFHPAFASHNIRSLSHAIVYADQIGLDRSDFELQTLYGMGEEFKIVLIKLGYKVREYCPIGELLPGMAYLVRRLLENTANEGFLRKVSYDKNTNYKEILAKPINS